MSEETLLQKIMAALRKAYERLFAQAGAWDDAWTQRKVHRLIAKLGNNGNDIAMIRAVDALAQIGEDASESVPALIKLLNDENSGVRIWAAMALGRVGDANVIPALFAAAAKHPELQEELQKIVDDIAKRDGRPTGVRKVDRRPEGFKQTVRAKGNAVRLGR